MASRTNPDFEPSPVRSDSARKPRNVLNPPGSRTSPYPFPSLNTTAENGVDCHEQARHHGNGQQGTNQKQDTRNLISATPSTSTPRILEGVKERHFQGSFSGVVIGTFGLRFRKKCSMVPASSRREGASQRSSRCTSPRIDKIEQTQVAFTRRANCTFLRDRVAKPFA